MSDRGARRRKVAKPPVGPPPRSRSRAASWRLRAVVVAVPAVALAAVVTWRLAAAPPVDAPTARASATAAREVERLRPRTWMGRPFADRPPERHVRKIERELADLHALPNPEDERAPLDDPEAEDRIREAQRLVAEEAPIDRRAFRWSDVARTVGEIGNAIPVRRPGPPDERVRSVATLAYDELADQVVVMDPEAVRVPAEVLAGLLVHEATHRVFSDELRARAGYDRVDLHLALGSCTDVDGLVRLVTEAAAYGNQALWLERHPRGRLGMGPHQLEIDTAARLFFADPTRGAGRLVPLLMPLNERVAAAQRVKKSGVCGPMIVLGARGRGEYLYPSDLEPALFLPLVDEAERAAR